MSEISTLHLPVLSNVSREVVLPGSKSISNRVLLLAALANGQTKIRNLLDSDDTQRMLEALTVLQVPIQHLDQEYWLTGQNGRFSVQKAQLSLGNAGTAFRPLVAALAVMGGDFLLDGVARMRERPIKDLVDALRIAGAQIDYIQNEGFPPVQIGSFIPSKQRVIPIKGSVSSQFLTALLMALPLTGHAYEIEVEGTLISKPYIAITLNLMAKFGVFVKHENFQHFWLSEGLTYRAPEHILVEGDASSASYFLAAGVLSGQPVRVKGVGKNSIQGDVAFADVLAKIGGKITWSEDFIEASRETNQVIKPFDLDLNHIPDAAMTLAIVALAANGTSTLRNIESWRVKETDRIAAMATELRKLGATVIEGQDFIQITPPEVLKSNVAIDTYDDHRMAMCFALVSLLNTPIIINEPECVNKTFPGFFQVFQK
ncbi:3-phosphoshikimate 1-carboxyvinyltransferase [Neisseria sp. Ec49-e6-T10]|uniref:3-phosphoshikimate 1-carboxyvinyltransferase n=1 Tax=Neisseria sp. Ec49-e6-T10 TaxID=3140744 RepID=UPI003EB6DB37